MQRMIVYGSCQATELGRILAASPRVREVYDVRVHWVGEQYHNTDAWAQEVADADVVFMQDVVELKSYPLWHWNQARARFIKYPYLTMPGFWPLDTALGEADSVANEARAAGRGLEFGFQDRLLALMRRHIPDHDKRYRAYATLSSEGHPEIAALLGSLKLAGRLRHAMAALARKDTRYQLSVGGAVAMQSRSTQTFHAVTHPTLATLRRMAGEMLGKVGIPLEQLADVTDGFADYQVPVHPLVAEALGLSWAPPGRQWNTHGSRLTFEQYYRQYIHVFG